MAPRPRYNSMDFYPRSPCGERHPEPAEHHANSQFLSTLSLRRATRLGLLGWLRTLISIHALLAESDKIPYQRQIDQKNFYPRSPCGERPPRLAWLASHINFYPRSPCGERPNDAINGCNSDLISIHALLAESDDARRFQSFRQSGFLSTLSLRRATIGPLIFSVQPRNFYPRSPCGERLIHLLLCNAKSDFYPRSPCGERRTMITTICIVSKFLSTLSLRRATMGLDGRFKL